MGLSLKECLGMYRPWEPEKRGAKPEAAFFSPAHKGVRDV